MTRQHYRIYADTSVFGGVFDDAFQTASQTFFDYVRAGIFRLVTSEIVQQEISLAPDNVIQLFDEMLEYAEIADIDEDSIALRNSYIKAGIVSDKCLSDAMHVAIATTNDCPVIISWNFKHIVNFQRIPMYNLINVKNGYRTIAIHSPQEMSAI